MYKKLLKIFLLLLFSIHHIAYAQEPQEPQAPQKEQAQKEDFFDKVEAPITYKGAFTKMMLTLLALIVLIVISVWMLRRISHGRMKQMNYGRSIKIVERRPLSAKSVLYLVEVEGKKVVVAESQLDVRTITTADHLNIDEN